MPTLRPLTDVARADAKFFVDVVLPALAAAGYHGAVALVVTDGGSHGDTAAADVVIEGSADNLEALLAGKQKTALSALDKLKAHKRSSSASANGAPAERSTVSVRGRADALRELVDALAPKAQRARAHAKEIGAEAGAVVRSKRDRVRTIDGRYIKGLRSGAGPKERAPPSAPAALVGVRASASPDRTGFALQNLAAFVSAGLRRVVELAELAEGDSGVLIIEPGEVRRG